MASQEITEIRRGKSHYQKWWSDTVDKKHTEKEGTLIQVRKEITEEKQKMEESEKSLVNPG